MTSLWYQAACSLDRRSTVTVARGRSSCTPAQLAANDLPTCSLPS